MTYDMMLSLAVAVDGVGIVDARPGDSPAQCPVLQVYTYDGSQVCAFRPQGLTLEGFSRQLVSLSNDTLAMAVGCNVYCYETAQGRPVGEVLNHCLDVKAVCISQVGCDAIAAITAVQE